MNTKDLYRVVAIMFAAFILVTFICIVTNTSAIEATPETEAVETTECTTAPIETSVPETTEYIHIEPTEMSSEALSAPVSDDNISEVSGDELEMLACVIYQEAGGDGSCDMCRRRVADVVLNRVADDRFPDTIYGVLTARSQYGRFHWTGVVWPERANNPGEKNAVERAWRIAEEVLAGTHGDLYGRGYIWQAEFKQGTDIVECCGHYFGR